MTLYKEDKEHICIPVSGGEASGSVCCGFAAGWMGVRGSSCAGWMGGAGSGCADGR